ncbi:hypothetical protein E3O06_11770 [Cryobacterium glaciale]|uniref:Uncharacterized protein n=1 Tax=Cryobacterium glaciale TaxID=1259145 RepID=A0A4R8UTC4_9MICO|nr:hypothetical protein [Cryobacterium glaciale]TFB71517.1 hypothetical protein E3O06_11770 [Cryobacterium glaciale]
MAETNDLNSDIRVVADHLDAFTRPLTYDEFVHEISVVVPASSDVHWMADNQLVNIFFARRTADTSLLTERIRQWIQ